jgi:hypothetical protein
MDTFVQVVEVDRTPDPQGLKDLEDLLDWDLEGQVNDEILQNPPGL